MSASKLNYSTNFQKNLSEMFCKVCLTGKRANFQLHTAPSSRDSEINTEPK